MRGLADQGIAFEPLRHPRTETAKEEAQMLHASTARVGKTVVVHTVDGLVRVVIQASERLSLAKLRATVGHEDARLATEEELATAYPAFELGAVPPFGGPEEDDIVIDRHVTDLESVIVEAGSHSDSVRLATADLLRITDATVADVIAD